MFRGVQRSFRGNISRSGPLNASMKLKKAYFRRTGSYPLLNRKNRGTDFTRVRLIHMVVFAGKSDEDEDEDEGAEQNQPVYWGDDGSELGSFTRGFLLWLCSNERK